MDPWDRLDLDGHGFHAKARHILDDPADWSGDDEFAPHGNDIGADIVNDWSTYRRLGATEAGNYLELPPLANDTDDYYWTRWVQLHALAFGHIKKHGRCPDRIAAGARDLMAREFARNKARDDWPHREHWQARLIRYDRILYDFDTRSD